MAFPAVEDLVFIKGGFRGGARLGADPAPSSGSSFWDTFGSGYTPGTFTKALQAGLTSSTGMARSLAYPRPSIPTLTSLQASNVSALQSRSSPFAAAASINPATFSIEIPNLTGGGFSSGGASRGGIGRIAVLAGVIGLAVVGFKKFRAKKAGAAA